LPGVKSTLFQLHAAGFQLAVLSDSEHTADVLQSRLEHLGLSGLFAAVVSSIDLGTTKPDPLAYATALREMNLTASETTFVGHDAEELAGAAQAGMTTVAFNFDPEAKADTYLSRFDELLDVVGVRTPYAAAG
jgi:HAD superfamily hydrolase (TIGR01509 family)